MSRNPDTNDGQSALVNGSDWSDSDGIVVSASSSSSLLAATWHANVCLVYQHCCSCHSHHHVVKFNLFKH